MGSRNLPLFSHSSTDVPASHSWNSCLSAVPDLCVGLHTFMEHLASPPHTHTFLFTFCLSCLHGLSPCYLLPHTASLTHHLGHCLSAHIYLGWTLPATSLSSHIHCIHSAASLYFSTQFYTIWITRVHLWVISSAHSSFYTCTHTTPLGASLNHVWPLSFSLVVLHYLSRNTWTHAYTTRHLPHHTALPTLHLPCTHAHSLSLSFFMRYAAPLSAHLSGCAYMHTRIFSLCVAAAHRTFSPPLTPLSFATHTCRPFAHYTPHLSNFHYTSGPFSLSLQEMNISPSRLSLSSLS